MLIKTFYVRLPGFDKLEAIYAESLDEATQRASVVFETLQFIVGEAAPMTRSELVVALNRFIERGQI